MATKGIETIESDEIFASLTDEAYLDAVTDLMKIAKKRGDMLQISLAPANRMKLSTRRSRHYTFYPGLVGGRRSLFVQLATEEEGTTKDLKTVKV